jgi:hypothetical protein
VDVEGCASGVHSDDYVPVAGGEVVGLFVGDAVFFVYESCEDVAGAGVYGFGERVLRVFTVGWAESQVGMIKT